MKVDSRFLKRPDTADMVQFTIDGEQAEARAGDTVAAAILAHSGGKTRLSAMGAPRTAYCMMGVCFECRVTVDGRPNTQGCTIIVENGMDVRCQNDLRLVGRDF